MKTRAWAVAAVLALSVAGCATYRSDLARGVKHYEANDHDAALAVFRSLEPDIDSLSDQDRTRYYYYRGMTDFRLSTPDYDARRDARYWLGLSSANEEEHPGGLVDDQKERLKEALDDLNRDVYGTAGGAVADAKDAKKSDAKKDDSR